MPYVVRDKNGCVVSVLAHPSGEASERLAASDEEIEALFSGSGAARQLQEVLVASDLSFVRVLEDLIGALLDRSVITLTDLPKPARDKLLQRQTVRSHLTNLSGLIEDSKEGEDFLI